MKIRLLLLASLLSPAILAAADSAPNAAAARILERVKVLASDDFEGRAPGSPGEEKSVAYIIAQAKKIGLQPGNPDGTFIQNAPLVGITSTPTLTFTTDGRTVPMENINEFVGPSSRLVPHLEAKDIGVVFVGYGVVAPE